MSFLYLHLPHKIQVRGFYFRLRHLTSRLGSPGRCLRPAVLLSLSCCKIAPAGTSAPDTAENRVARSRKPFKSNNTAFSSWKARQNEEGIIRGTAIRRDQHRGRSGRGRQLRINNIGEERKKPSRWDERVIVKDERCVSVSAVFWRKTKTAMREGCWLVKVKKKGPFISG